MTPAPAVTLTPEARRLMNFTLSAFGDSGHHQYRNRYCARRGGEAHAIFEDLRTAGLATRISDIGMTVTYSLTQAGIDLVSKEA